MWVTIDARALDGSLMGTQVLVLELVRALARSKDLPLRVLVRAERIDEETLSSLRALPAVELLAEQEIDASTPASAVFHRPQQAFSPADVALACRLGERVVLSQLDLIAYRNREYFPDAGTWEAYRRAGRQGMAAAERVVVLSEHTRGELLGDALVEDERIRVVPPGLDHSSDAQPRKPAALDGLLGGQAPDGGQPGFLLCLGTDYLHKNRVFALRMLAALRERHGWKGALVLAGMHVTHGSSRELERRELDGNAQLREAVIDLGPVGEAEKEWLLRNAAAVVYPSLYEGFGMVPLEAAVRGVPCLYAPLSSLAEGAVGQAAAIVPWDAARSAEAAVTLLREDGARARHVQLLADAARELTWERAAGAMVEVYREAAGAPVRVAATVGRDAIAREAELTAAHERVVERLIEERELVLTDYERLLAEVGPARSLIGERGSLPPDLQRALLALSARPVLSRPLFALLALCFRAARTVARYTLQRP